MNQELPFFHRDILRDTKQNCIHHLSYLPDDELIITATEKADSFLCTCNFSVSLCSPTYTRRDSLEGILMSLVSCFLLYCEAALNSLSLWEATASPQVFFVDAVPNHSLAHWLFFMVLAHWLIFIFLQSLGAVDRCDKSKWGWLSLKLICWCTNKLVQRNRLLPHCLSGS